MKRALSRAVPHTQSLVLTLLEEGVRPLELVPPDHLNDGAESQGFPHAHGDVGTSAKFHMVATHEPTVPTPRFSKMAT